MKKSTLITEISLEDFLKLNLTGYEHRKHYYRSVQIDNCYLPEVEIEYKDTGEWVIDSKGERHWVNYKNVFSRITWDKVNLNDIVMENIEWSKKQGFKNRCICLAIHTEPSKEEIEELRDRCRETDKSPKMPKEEALEQLLFSYSYLDKWLTRCGYQTYLLRCDVKHLYSEKRKFCTHDDYFDVPKSETKVIYLIRY